MAQFFPNGIISIDLETTGLSPLCDEIIEVGGVKWHPEGVERFASLINPGCPIPEQSRKIHGISDADVTEQPTFKKIGNILSDYLNGAPLLAHNAKFDLGFLIHSWKRTENPMPECEIYCSCQYARVALKTAENFKLSTLAHYLNIPLENHHRAYDDALASFHIFAKCLEEQPEKLSNAKLLSTKDYLELELSQIPDHLQNLIEPTRNQEKIEIFYTGGTVKKRWREVIPTSLLPMPNGHVLYALCVKSDVYKSFLLQKIQEWRYPQR